MFGIVLFIEFLLFIVENAVELVYPFSQNIKMSFLGNIFMHMVLSVSDYSFY